MDGGESLFGLETQFPALERLLEKENSLDMHTELPIENYNNHIFFGGLEML